MGFSRAIGQGLPMVGLPSRSDFSYSAGHGLGHGPKNRPSSSSGKYALHHTMKHYWLAV